MQEKVKCLICEREFSSINSRHLAQHGLTRESYLELYPDAELVSEASLLRKKNGAASRNQNYTEEQKKEIAKKAAETRKERGIRPWNYGVKGYKLERSEEAKKRVKERGPWNKGGHLSEEQKAKLSKTKKERYASGETIHWNTGRTTSEETKQKIRASVTGMKLTREQRQKIKDAHLKRKAAGLYVNAMKGRHHSDETRNKLSKAGRKGGKGYNTLRKNLEQRGKWIPHSEMNLFKLYKRQVARLTEENVNKIKGYDHTKRGRCLTDSDNHQVDHIYSVTDGFINGILPQIIAHHVNLRFIPWRQNLRKWNTSDMTLDELMELIAKQKD